MIRRYDLIILDLDVTLLEVIETYFIEEVSKTKIPFY